MKLTVKTIYASLIALAAAACTKPAISELTGMYNAPVDAVLQGASAEVQAEKQDGFYDIQLSLAGKDAVVLKFASKDYFITPTTYYINDAEGIKAGMYYKGSSTVNGKGIIFGSLTVDGAPVGDSDTDFAYDITGVVMTGENERTRVEWHGTLVFEKPAVADADYLFSETVTPVEGTSVVQHNVVLFADGAPAGQLELYTNPGQSIEGKYSVVEYASSQNKPGVAGNGYSFPQWGVLGGSYIYVEGNIVTINAGETITIAADPETGFYKVSTTGGFDFTMDQYLVAYPMTMASSSNVTDENNAPVEGFDRWDIQIKDGDNLVAAFDLVVTAGTSIEGEYTVAGYPHADHVAGNGWGIAAWNYFGGTRFMAADGLVYVNPGSTVKVTLNADGSYTFAVSGQFQSSADGSAPYEGSVKFKGVPAA